MTDWYGELQSQTDVPAPAPSNTDWYKEATQPVEALTKPIEQGAGALSAQNIGSGLVKNVSGIVGLPQMIAQGAATGLNKLGEYEVKGINTLTGADLPTQPTFGVLDVASKLWPSYEEVHNYFTKELGLPDYKAKNAAERYAQSAAEFVGNPKKIIQDMIASALSETAGHAMEGTSAELPARLVGAATGHLGTTAAKAAIAPNASEMIARRTQGLNPEDFVKAQELQTQGKDIGVPLLGSESIQNAGLRQLTSDVMASPTGSAPMEQFLQLRPEQIRTAKEAQLEQIGPESTPLQVTSRAQEAATNVLKGAEKERSAAARPFYEEAKKVQLTPEERSPLIAKIDAEIAATPLTSLKSQLEALKTQVNASTDIGMLDSVRKDTRDQLSSKAFGENAITKEAASKIRPILGDMKTLMLDKSSAYGEGLKTSQAMAKNVINPLRASSIGKMAGKGFEESSIPQQQRVMSVISDWQEARPRDIIQTASELNKVDRTVFPSMVRNELESAFNTASKDLLTGENRNIGAKFRQNIYGNDQQKQNLKAMFRGISEAQGLPPEATWKAFDNMLNVFERTGTVPGTGSQTAMRGIGAQEAGKSKIAGAMQMVSTAPLSSVKNEIRDFMQRKTYADLAKILTAPDSVQQIRELSKAGKGSAKARFLTNQLLTASRNQGRENEQKDQTQQ